MDKAAVLGLLAGMDEEPPMKLMTPASLALDAVLVAIFSVYMYSVVSEHVPSSDPHDILVWGIYTTSCLSALFWLALQMFRVVVRFQLASRRARGK